MTKGNGINMDHQGPDEYTDEYIMVCGLGSLGQNCVAVLKKYGVRVIAVNLRDHEYWEFEGFSDYLEDLVIGDCRRPEVLTRARIQQCRAVLLVTENERTNTEAALAARLKNPNVRLILRSAKKNLNHLLGGQLGNFVAFEPTRLSAPSFALAALGERMVGYFHLEDRKIRVIRHRIQKGDLLEGQPLKHLNTRSQKVLAHFDGQGHSSGDFHAYLPEARLQSGDTLVYVSIGGQWSVLESDETTGRTGEGGRKGQGGESWGDEASFKKGPKWRRRLTGFGQSLLQNQVRKVALICVLTVLLLLGVGSILFRYYGSGLGVIDAVYATTVLLLGGYSDLLGAELRFNLPIPWWLRLFGLLLTMVGTVLVGIIYALMTGSILAARFHFHRRPQPPRQGHVVLVGLGRVGRRVADMMREFGLEVVGVTKERRESELPADVPVISGDGVQSLGRTNLERARSLVAITDDEMVNLEVGLMARDINPDCRLVIRTYRRGFRDNVARLFPYARVLCSSALAAEAFAAAAFGEDVPSLFLFHDRTILVTQYQIRRGDSLHGLILAEVAYGYGILPILLNQGERGLFWMPIDDKKLHDGDILTVLATTESLRRVENGEFLPRRYNVLVKKAMTESAVFEGANTIAQISGCSLEEARKLMENLPGRLPAPIYRHQAHRLAITLRRTQVEAEMIAPPSEGKD